MQASAMGGVGVDDQLWIADVRTDAVRARLGFGHDDRAAAAVGRTLDALAFTEVVEIRRLDENEAGKRAVIFPSSGIEVTFDDGTARVRRGGYLIGAGSVIVGAGVTIGDGCGAWSYDHVLRILAPGSDKKATAAPKNRRKRKDEIREGDHDDRGIIY